jgi:hypothetical protein
VEFRPSALFFAYFSEVAEEFILSRLYKEK